MDNLLDSCKFTDALYEKMCEVKHIELSRVWTAYDCTPDEFKRLLRDKLAESNMHMGACNMAVDFLIVDVDKGKLNDTYAKAISENILGASIYYANCMGKDPVYKGFIG